MKKLGRKAISLLLALTLIFGLIPMYAVAAETGSPLTLRASTVSAIAGSTVTVKLDLENNPGIASLKVKVAYSDILTLTGVTFNADMGGQSQMPQNLTSPVTLAWYNGTDNFTGSSATFATLTFTISQSAQDNAASDISISYNNGDVYNIAETDIPLTVVNGSVTVLPCVPGDINGDGSTNMKDLTRLFQYLADWNVTVNEKVLDVNGDGSVNMKDLTRLFQYLADWNVEIYPQASSTPCTHTMEAVAYKAATCTEAGNTAYWHCTKCNKYFSNEAGTSEIQLSSTVIPALGHSPVAIPAVPVTDTTVGYTEGSKCSRCGIILVQPVEIPIPVPGSTRNITYNVANGDSYIETKNVVNSNPKTLAKTSSLTLKTLSVPGYLFLGWYDLPSGANAVNIKTIAPGDEDIELYAHWEKIEYTVQFKSNLYPIASISYTVDKGTVLPSPMLSNYVFAGWSDEEGKMYNQTSIPKGTTGNITLTANWTSERNRTTTKTKLDPPIIYEDEANHTIYFAYEIGTIENVPLYTIHDFGYISGDGVTKTETTTYSMTTSSTEMTSYTNVLASATTQSSNWTLANGWSENTSISEEWRKEHNISVEEAERRGKSSTNNWNVSSSKGGAHDSTALDSTQDNAKSEVRIENSTEDKIAAGLTSNIGAEAFGVSAGISASLNVEETAKNGMAVDQAVEGTNIHTGTTASNSNWSTASSYGGSEESTRETSTSKAITDMLSNTSQYGKNYISSSDWTKSQGFSTTTDHTDEYSVATTYSKVVEESRTSTWTTQATKPGYHRWIIAGTAHVFAVVGYDIAKKSYFVCTYSIMDDKTQEFEDYSYTSGSYTDNQNGVISFEVPYEIADYVAERTCASSGLVVDQTTGEITAYTGTDNCVVIPEYMNVGSGDVVKVTGISASAFAGNTNITAVVLSDFITAIPAGAFAGCTSLVGLIGGSITSIGSGAFSGCTLIADCGITTKVTNLGDNAFTGAAQIRVNAANAEVAEAAVKSGAKRIVLYFNSDKDISADLQGKTLTVPDGTEYFEINGYGRTYSDLSVVSGAAKTVINKANFVNTSTVPLSVSSAEVILNNVNLQSPGLSLIMSAEQTNLGLQGTININSALTKDLNLYAANTSVLGKLAVADKMFVCDTITGNDLLSCSNIQYITADNFDKMLHSFTLTIDANGGTLTGTSTKEITYGTPYGDLPTPKRDYYTFSGWYTARDGGTLVTKDTVNDSYTDVTIYAHWTENTVSDWVLASSAPADAQVVNRKYLYDQTFYTQSSSNSMSGWTLYNTAVTGKTDWGPWSDWLGYNPGASTDYREVQSEYVDTSYNLHEYHYYCWCTSAYDYWTTKSAALNAHPDKVAKLNEIWVQSEMTFYRSANGVDVYKGPAGSNYDNPYWIRADGAYGGLTPYERDTWISQGYTHWHYRDRQDVYTYYFSRVESNKESATNPSGTDISNVREYVQYRSK